MQSLIVVTATLLLVAALPYLITYWKMLHRTFSLRSELASYDQMPEHLKTFFKPIIAELESCGFQVAEYRLAEQTVEDDKKWEVLLQHPIQQVYVSCDIRELKATTPSLLTFFTFLEDGRLLATVNIQFYGIYSRNPQDIVQYLGNVSIVEQWQAHQRQLESTQKTIPRLLSPEAFMALWKEHSQRNIQRLAQNKEVYWVVPGETYRMRWWTTAQAVFKVARAGGRKGHPQHPVSVVSDSIPTTKGMIILEVAQFYHWQQQQKGLSQKKKLWLLMGTLALFVISYASLFDPYRLAIFVAVLLFHEGGHVLAMKCFGYRDITMLFVPFLGALATARKENASLTEKVWTSLAGPLPGLILGIGLAIAVNPHIAGMASVSNWYIFKRVREASTLLILLNLFNLLPIYPLDGGQVADLLLFSRNPYLGVLFKGVSVLLLGLSGLGLHQPIILGFAVLIGISIPQSLRLAKLNTGLRQELRQISSENLVLFLFSKLQDSPYQSLPFARKYTLVQGILASHRESLVKWSTRVGLFGVYLLSLLIGIFGGLYSFLPSWHLITTALSSAPPIPIIRQQQMKQEIERVERRLKVNPRDVQAHSTRSGMRERLKDYQGALSDANQIIRLEPNNLRGYKLRHSVRMRLGDKTGAAADLAKVQNLQNQEVTQQIQQLNRALIRNPKDINIYLIRATLHTVLRHYDNAIADCNQVLQLEPHNIKALLKRGNIYLGFKNYNQAISNANQVLNIKPDSMQAYSLRSEARHQLGDKTGAYADRQKADAIFQMQNKDD